MSQGAFIFWVIIAPSYMFMWLVCSAFFTRHWVEQLECVEECSRVHYKKVSGSTNSEWAPDAGDMWDWAWKGEHAPRCNTWRHKGLVPSEAMVFAVAWPFTMIHFILTYVHRYEPKPKPGKIKLTQQHIDYIDSVLEDESVTQLEMRNV